MLTSTLLTLTPRREGDAPASQGRAIQGWFLGRIAAHDPALADRLHAGSALRPYTLSNLIGVGRPRDGRIHLHPECPCTLRLTALNAEMVKALAAALPAEGDVVPLAEADLVVSGIVARAADHPWAGCATYTALIQALTLSPAPPPRTLRLRFASPTTFHARGLNVPFPLPGLVFGSLMQRWNAFAGVQLPEELREYAETTVEVGRYRTASDLASFERGNKGAHVGFTGVVTYRPQHPDPYWARLMHLLAVYSLWAGVGRRTTMGMGQVRLLIERGKRSTQRHKGRQERKER